MTATIGQSMLKVRLISYNKEHCNAKLVFDNLEEILKLAGYKLTRSETREDGRGSAPALRIYTRSPKMLKLEIPVRLVLNDHDDGYYDHKLVFHHLKEKLESSGVPVGMCQTRAAGRESDLALRLNIA